MRTFLKGLVQFIVYMAFGGIGAVLVQYGFVERIGWVIPVSCIILVWIPSLFLSSKIMKIITSEKEIDDE